MKIFLEKAIFVNKAPFDKLELDFKENEISTLSAMNGKGKTTIISHIVDALHEMSRPHFQNEFEGKANKFYRLSSPLQNLSATKSSFVYLRFKLNNSDNNEVFDYLEIRNKCSEDEYNEAISLTDKIQFGNIKPTLDEANCAKLTSLNFNKEKAEKIFLENVLTYFPSYRYEAPGYLNDAYKINLDFRKQSGFSGFLKNPIEVISGLPQLANWIMDVALDSEINKGNQSLNILNQVLVQNINMIITNSIAKDSSTSLRFGIGLRNNGGIRIQILDIDKNKTVYPTIFNLSSGEASILCIFGEIIRQADNIKNSIQLNDINGIVLIDEIDKHLHIKLQKEILPKLLKLLPNVQFIISSHSPFLSMGLAEDEELKNRSSIIDLDNFGISKDPTTNDLYKEVYNMMVGENDRFKEMFEDLNKKISEGERPLIITEGKTDVWHLEKAKEKLDITCDVDFYDSSEESLGDTNLKTLLESYAKIRQPRKIIGIFDRDNEELWKKITTDGSDYRNYKNNVFAFRIPPIDFKNESGEVLKTDIEIEHYYPVKIIKSEVDGKRMYLGSEFQLSGPLESDQSITIQKLSEYQKRIKGNHIIDKGVNKRDDINNEVSPIPSLALSKTGFSQAIKDDVISTTNEDFDNFQLIFDKIKEILSQK